MKYLVVTPDNVLYEREFAAPLYEEIGEVVGGYIEVVHPVHLGAPMCLVVNEEGLLENLDLNLFGSILYGMAEHGQPILGDVVIAKEGWTPEGPDFVPFEDVELKNLRYNILKSFTFIKEKE